MTVNKALVALALAISVGVLAVIAATLYLDRRGAASSEAAASVTSQSPPAIPTKNVLVFARPLKRGMRIEKDDIRLQAVPLHALPPNHVVNQDDLVGRRVSVATSEDTPVVLDMLIPRKQDIEMAGLRVDGMRAYSLNVSEAGEVSGFVLPDNRVDVLLNGNNQAGEAFSRMVVQDVKVLAVARNRFVQDRTVAQPSGMVTLEVTPSQAEMLDMARSVGTLSFALRAQSDRSTAMTLGARQEELHESKQVVEVIRGTVRSFE